MSVQSNRVLLVLAFLLSISAVGIGCASFGGEDEEPTPEAAGQVEGTPDSGENAASTDDDPVVPSSDPDPKPVAEPEVAKEPEPEPEAPRYDDPDHPALTVLAIPRTAKVRIENIEGAYRPGMRLPPGDYDVVVEAPDYQPKRRRIRLDLKDKRIEVKLAPR